MRRDETRRVQAARCAATVCCVLCCVALRWVPIRSSTVNAWRRVACSAIAEARGKDGHCGVITWRRGAARRWGRTGRALQRRLEWGSCRRTDAAAARRRERPRRPLCRSRSRQPDRTDPHSGRRRAARSSYTKQENFCVWYRVLYHLCIERCDSCDMISMYRSEKKR